MFKQEKRVGLVGAPFEKGQRNPGSSCSPKLLRVKKIMEEIEKHGLNVHDFGDVECHLVQEDNNIFNAKFPRTFLKNSITISRKIEEIMNQDYIALTIGGDHSISVGTILGHSKVHENISVIWVDAHADINTPLSSISKNMHGMPLAFSIHEMQDEMPWIEEFKDLPSVISAKHVAYIGLRDVDPYERFVLNKYNIKTFSMEEIDKHGINCVIQEAINVTNPKLDRYFHLSFDVDALDPLYAPSTGTKVPGGLSLREGIYICEQLSNTGKLAAIDIAEINAQIGSYSDAVITLNSSIKIILGSLGIRREGAPILDPEYNSWRIGNPTRSEIFSILNAKH